MGKSSMELMIYPIHPASNDQLTPAELSTTLENIKVSLEEVICIGVPIGYLPKTNPNELYQVFCMAGDLISLLFSHSSEPNSISIQKVITNSALTIICLHNAHINNMALGNIQLSLAMVNQCLLVPFPNHLSVVFADGNGHFIYELNGVPFYICYIVFIDQEGLVDSLKLVVSQFSFEIAEGVLG